MAAKKKADAAVGNTAEVTQETVQEAVSYTHLTLPTIA